MSDSQSQLRAMIERIVHLAVLGEISKGQATDKAIAALEEHTRSITPAEKDAEYSAKLLAEYDELGGDRSAAAKVARRYSGDDPHAAECIAQRIRRLARCRKTNGVRFDGPPSGIIDP